MTRSATGMAPIPTPEINGVRVSPRLAREAADMVGTLVRLGRRLRHQLRALAPGAIPDPAWLETYKVYDKSMRGMLAEQRERARLAKIADRGAELTDEQADEEMILAIREYLDGAPAAEIERLLSGKVIEAQAVERRDDDREEI